MDIDLAILQGWFSQSIVDEDALSLGSELKLDFGHGAPEDGGVDSEVEVIVHDEFYNIAKLTMFYATYFALG